MESITAVAVVALVIGLTEVVKRIIGENKFAPLFALLFGVAINFLVNPDPSYNTVILSGLVDGLTAVGLYSTVKNTTEKLTPTHDPIL